MQNNMVYLSDRVKKASDQEVKHFTALVPKYIEDFGLETEQGAATLTGVFKWILNDFSLEMHNTGWDNRNPPVEFSNILDNMKESVVYWLEHDFGYEQETPPSDEEKSLSPETRKTVNQIHELFQGFREAGWQGNESDKPQEYVKSKAAAYKFLYDLGASLAQKIPQLQSPHFANAYKTNTALANAYHNFRHR